MGKEKIIGIGVVILGFGFAIIGQGFAGNENVCLLTGLFVALIGFILMAQGMKE